MARSRGQRPPPRSPPPPLDVALRPGRSRQPGGQGSGRVPHPIHSPRAWLAGPGVPSGKGGSNRTRMGPPPQRAAHRKVPLQARGSGALNRVAAARDKRAAPAPRLIYAAPRPAPRPPQRGRHRRLGGRGQGGRLAFPPCPPSGYPPGWARHFPRAGPLRPVPTALRVPSVEGAGAARVGARPSVL